MLRLIVIALLLLAAHFNLTALAPAPAGKGSLYWPFAADSHPWLSMIGGPPQQSGSLVTPLLAGIAGLCFLAAAMSLIGWLVPAGWWRLLVLVAAACSIMLYGLYIGPVALIPLSIDGLLLWGLLAQSWSVTALRGA
jgi:hypothetical protein